MTSFIFDFDEQRKETPKRTLSDELPLAHTETRNTRAEHIKTTTVQAAHTNIIDI